MIKGARRQVPYQDFMGREDKGGYTISESPAVLSQDVPMSRHPVH